MLSLLYHYVFVTVAILAAAVVAALLVPDALGTVAAIAVPMTGTVVGAHQRWFTRSRSGRRASVADHSREGVLQVDERPVDVDDGGNA